MQGLTFPPSGARLATLLCHGGRGGGEAKQRGGFARAGIGQMDRGPHGGHLGNRRDRGDLGHDTAIIEGI